jgi:hypothetical protein
MSNTLAETNCLAPKAQSQPRSVGARVAAVLSEHGALLAVLAIAAIVYLATIRQGHHWGGDFSMYIAEAKNIAHGLPYENTGFVWVPGMGVHNPLSYPPLFPLILAPFYAWFGNDYFVFKVVVQALLLGSLLLYYAIGRTMGLSQPMSALATVVFGLSAPALELKENVASDAAYLLFAGMFLCAASVIYSRDLNRRYPFEAALVITTLFMLGCATRVAGVTWIAALLIYDCWRTRRVTRFGLITAACGGSALALYSIFLYSGGRYGDQVTIDGGTYMNHLLYYFATPAELWSASPSVLRYPLTAFAIAMAAAAFVRRFLRGTSILEWYSLASIATAIAFTSGRGERYLLPFLALFPFYMCDGANWLASAVSKRWVPAAGGVLAAVLLLATGFNLAHMERGAVRDGVLDPSFLAVCDYLKKETPPESVVVSWNPRVFSLYTERRGTHYAHTSDPAEFSRVLAAAHADVAVVYSKSAEDKRWLKPFLEGSGQTARLNYENGDFRVYFLSLAEARKPAG